MHRGWSHGRVRVDPFVISCRAVSCDTWRLNVRLIATRWGRHLRAEFLSPTIPCPWNSEHFKKGNGRNFWYCTTRKCSNRGIPPEIRACPPARLRNEEIGRTPRHDKVVLVIIAQLDHALDCYFRHGRFATSSTRYTYREKKKKETRLLL